MSKTPPSPSPWTPGRILSLVGALALMGMLTLHLIDGPGRRGSSSSRPKGGRPSGGVQPATVSGDPNITTETLPKWDRRVIADHEHILDEREARRVLKVMDRFGIEKLILLGTSKYTFTLNKKYGFERFKENNEEIIRLAKKWPDRFIAFPTVFPPDSGNVELMQDYVKRGAQGLKLYLGHGSGTGKEPFHMMPLDDPRMKPLYRWAQEEQVPIQFHINFTKYYAEFVRVMEEFPYLRVCVPHYGLYKNSSSRLRKLGALMDRYPNVYSDISFGWYEFQIQGFDKFDQHPKRYRDFMIRHADRFMYSADMVVEPSKTEQYIVDTLRSYMQVLEMDEYRFFLKPERLYRGLNLPRETLKKIYWETPATFHILDERGLPPDRTKGWPWPGWEGKAKPGLPPSVPVVTPLPPKGQ